jgi:3-deoxy-manno-octulosonate cytidylyltransferase (CMP-KDO synthetase)
MMSPETCRNGTERVAYVLSKTHFDIAINFQADAVLTPHWIIESVIEKMLTDEQAKIVTPAIKLDETLYNKLNEQKKAGVVGGTTVTFSKSFKALYFSKNIIPFIRNYSEKTTVYKHIGIYAYRKDTLLKLAQLPPSTLEECESLEQLRALENDIPIDIVLVDTKGRSLWAIDNPEDIKIVEYIIKKEGEII